MKLAKQAVGLWIGIGYPLACLALLWDEHHPWMDKHPWLAVLALVNFVGPLAIVGWMYRHWRKERERA